MREGYISVTDRHYTPGVASESEGGELMTKCVAGFDGDTMVIKYSEMLDNDTSSQVCLMIKDGVITMVRDGVMCTSMIFEKNKRHVCCYRTPAGELMIGVYTNAISTVFYDNGCDIHLLYTIDSNGNLVRSNELKIEVKLKDNE